MNKLCGWRKAMWPGIKEKSDEICLGCQRLGYDQSAALAGDS